MTKNAIPQNLGRRAGKRWGPGRLISGPPTGKEILREQNQGQSSKLEVGNPKEDQAQRPSEAISMGCGQPAAGLPGSLPFDQHFPDT